MSELNSKIEETEWRFSGLEDRTKVIIQSEQQKENRPKKLKKEIELQITVSL